MKRTINTSHSTVDLITRISLAVECMAALQKNVCLAQHDYCSPYETLSFNNVHLASWNTGPACSPASAKTKAGLLLLGMTRL